MAPVRVIFLLFTNFFILCTRSSPAGPPCTGCRTLQPAKALAPDPKHWPPAIISSQQNPSAEKVIPWAAFGDSYASGVTYNNFPNGNLDYDSDDPDLINRCRRIVDAYSVQLKNDPDLSWTNNRVPYLQFLACSGARFNDIAGQLTGIDDTYVPKFATLTIGGNDAGFFPVASNCIFHPNVGQDYGPDYPDQSGQCATAIKDANDNIDVYQNLSQPFINAFTGIINHEKLKDDNSFKVFVTGYAQFFNEDDPACDTYTLRLNGPKMTRTLRKALNDLVKHANQRLEDAITTANNPKVAFVSIDEGFNGHRFCEPNDSSGQLGNIKQRINSWFWSFSIFDNFSADPAKPPTCDPDLDINCSDPQPGDPKFDSEVSGIEITSGSDIGATPSATRTFHPKRDGHTAIEKTLLQAIKNEFKG